LKRAPKNYFPGNVGGGGEEIFSRRTIPKLHVFDQIVLMCTFYSCWSVRAINRANPFIMHFSFIKREFEKSQTSKPKKRREDGDSDEDMSDDEGILGIY
jgi:hypothetical protein